MRRGVKPKKNTKRTMDDVFKAQATSATDNAVRRAKNLQRLAENTDPLTAKYLIENPSAFKATVESHGIKDPQTLRALLAKKAQQ